MGGEAAAGMLRGTRLRYGLGLGAREADDALGSAGGGSHACRGCLSWRGQERTHLGGQGCTE